MQRVFSCSTFLTVILIFSACGREEVASVDHDVLPGLASVFQEQFEESVFHFEDYFMQPTDIDSFKVPAGLSYTLKDDNRMVLTGSQEQFYDEFIFWIDGKASHILSRKSDKEEYEITLSAEHGDFNSVKMKGEMNSWNPNENVLEPDNGTWRTTFLATPGQYQYIFVIDGEEVLDPDNPVQVPNGLGGYNSLFVAGDPEPGNLPFLNTYNHTRRSITLQHQDADSVFIYWQNSRLDYSTPANFIEFSIPAEARRMERSYIRVWSYNENGVSNDLLIPLQYGRVLTNPRDLQRSDHHAWNLYMIMIDRFYDGNPDNNRPLEHPEVDPRVDYYGGDFAGITKKIRDGYFTDLGINALWVTPVTQNPDEPYGLYPKPETKFSGYHGYWPISSSELDDRFGTEEEWIELLDTAHEHGIGVILDYVANHVHEDHPAIINNPDWKTDLYLPDGTMNTELWDEQRLTTWFDTFMPTLDFSKPEVIETMTDSALFWVKNYPLDGFRHDATKHVQTEFWRTLTRKIKEEVVVGQGRPVFQIGETYGSHELVGSYVGSGLLDAQFDFSIYDAGMAAFARGESMENLRNALRQSLNAYGYHHLMGNISGNHDKARFITMASGEISFDEDAKYAGWNREIGYPREIGYKKHSLNLALIFTIPGMPVLYQGDEFGQPGGDDPDNRRMMQFGDELIDPEKEQLERTRKLANLRNNHMSLQFGSFRFLHSDDHILAYQRRYFNEAAWIFLNNSDEPGTVEIEINPELPPPSSAHFGHPFTINRGILEITVEPHSFEIITNYQSN